MVKGAAAQFSPVTLRTKGLVSQSGLITVMTVGDKKSLAFHLGPKLGDPLGVRNLPDFIQDFFRIRHRHVWLTPRRLFQQGANALLIGIKGKDTAEVGVASLHQLQTVRLGAAQSMLVGQDAALLFSKRREF